MTIHRDIHLARMERRATQVVTTGSPGIPLPARLARPQGVRQTEETAALDSAQEMAVMADLGPREGAVAMVVMAES